VGGFCITEASSGIPGGYCTRTCTAQGNECGDHAVCFTGQNGAFCLQTCGSDGDCRMPGYICEPSFFGQTFSSKACVPGTRAMVNVGDPCASLGDCPSSWFCVGQQSGFPGGYCTKPCNASASTCPGDAFCALAFGFCLDGCTDSTQCRQPAYGCSSRVAGVTLSKSACVAFRDGAKVGDPCANFSECALGGACIPEVNSNGTQTGFTNGYCTAICGGTAPACPAGSFCQSVGRSSVCLEQCMMSSECRQSDGYVCQSIDGNMACIPPNL
jgi:hypothetical protein